MITANAAIIEWLANLLMHSAWMGTVAALVVWAVVRRATDPRHVHNLAFGGLLLVLVGLMTTGFWTWPTTTFYSTTFTQIAPVPTPPPMEASVAKPAQSFSSMPTATVPAETTWNWQTMLVALWCLGVLVMSLRHACGWWRALFLRQSATRVGGAIALRFTTLCRAAGMHPPLLLASSRIAVPAAIGWWRQAVIVPVGVLTGVPPAQLDALLLHELAHLRRHDWLVEVITSLIESLLFFHPAVWWLGRRLRQAREQCCDSQAVSLGATPDGLTRALLVLAERTAPDSPLLAATGGVLTERVRRILGLPKSYERPWRSLVVIAMLPLFLVVVAACTRPTSNSQASTEKLTIEPLDPTLLKVRESVPAFPHDRRIRAHANGRKVHVQLSLVSAPISFWHELGIDGKNQVHLNQSTLERVLNASETDKNVSVISLPMVVCSPLQRAEISILNDYAYISDYQLIDNKPDPTIQVLTTGFSANLWFEPTSNGVLLASARLISSKTLAYDVAEFPWPATQGERKYPIEIPIVKVDEGLVEPETLLMADDVLAVPITSATRVQLGQPSFRPALDAIATKRANAQSQDTPRQLVCFINAKTGTRSKLLNASANAAWLDTTKINLNLHQVPLDTALRALAEQLYVPVEVVRDTDYANTRVDLSAKAEPARTVIERLLAQCLLNGVAEPGLLRLEPPPASDLSADEHARNRPETRIAETLPSPNLGEVFLMIYDVSDIFENDPDGGVTRTNAQELATNLMKTICASTWVDGCEIEARSNRLFVSATPAVQNLIEAELQRRRDSVTQPIKPDAPK